MAVELVNKYNAFASRVEELDLHNVGDVIPILNVSPTFPRL